MKVKPKRKHTDISDTLLDDLKRDAIPRLQNALERANKYGVALQEENQQLKADLETLEKRLRHLLQSDFIASFDEWNRQKGNYNRDIKEADETIARVRTEAIKEFAERLKKEACYPDSYRDEIVWVTDIDNLVKEMG